MLKRQEDPTSLEKLKYLESRRAAGSLAQHVQGGWSISLQAVDNPGHSAMVSTGIERASWEPYRGERILAVLIGVQAVHTRRTYVLR